MIDLGLQAPLACCLLAAFAKSWNIRMLRQLRRSSRIGSSSQPKRFSRLEFSRHFCGNCSSDRLCSLTLARSLTTALFSDPFRKYFASVAPCLALSLALSPGSLLVLCQMWISCCIRHTRVPRKALYICIIPIGRAWQLSKQAQHAEGSYWDRYQQGHPIDQPLPEEDN